MKTRNALFEWNEARVARKRNNEPRKGVRIMNEAKHKVTATRRAMRKTEGLDSTRQILHKQRRGVKTKRTGIRPNESFLETRGDYRWSIPAGKANSRFIKEGGNPAVAY